MVIILVIQSIITAGLCIYKYFVLRFVFYHLPDALSLAAHLYVETFVLCDTLFVLLRINNLLRFFADFMRNYEKHPCVCKIAAQKCFYKPETCPFFYIKLKYSTLVNVYILLCFQAHHPVSLRLGSW